MSTKSHEASWWSFGWGLFNSYFHLLGPGLCFICFFLALFWERGQSQIGDIKLFGKASKPPSSCMSFLLGKTWKDNVYQMITVFGNQLVCFLCGF